MALAAEEQSAVRSKRTWWQRRQFKRRKEKLRKRQEAEEKEHEKRQKILGEYAAYTLAARTLAEGRDVELFAKPRWFRCHPAMPRFAKLKVRAVPEAGDPSGIDAGLLVLVLLLLPSRCQRCKDHRGRSRRVRPVPGLLVLVLLLLPSRCQRCKDHRVEMPTL